VPLDYRQDRLASLRAAQNPDGGWGYFPGKQSWLEPSAYALLALFPDGVKTDSWQRGFALVRSWQNSDGGFKPSTLPKESSWVTALAVTLHCVRGIHDVTFQRGISWMLGTAGTEGTLFERAINLVHTLPVEYDRRFKGWPWCKDNSSWVEPTAHSLVALKKAVRYLNPEPAEWKARVQDGEKMIADRRSVDGGWNYGNRRVYKTDLPSYPETTGIALLGLQASAVMDMKPSLALAEKYWRETTSPLAKTWLAISLRNYGVTLPDPDPGVPATADILLTALQCLACKDGGHQFLRAEGKT
jgi:hypothetical protein